MFVKSWMLILTQTILQLEASLQVFQFVKELYQPEGYSELSLETPHRNIHQCAIRCTMESDCGGIIFDRSQAQDCTLVVQVQKFVLPTTPSRVLVYPSYIVTFLLNNDFVQSGNTFIVLYVVEGVTSENYNTYCQHFIPIGEVLTSISDADARLMKKAFEKKESPDGEFHIGLNDADVEGEPRWLGDNQAAVLPSSVPFVMHTGPDGKNGEKDDYCTVKEKDGGFEIKYREISEGSNGVFCKVVL